MKIGTVYSISTSEGYGFLQLVGVAPWGSQIIRVLAPLKNEPRLNQSEVNQPERYSVGFALNTAARRKLVSLVGHFAVPESYQLPQKARTEHKIRGEFLGWHIVDQVTLHRELKKTLAETDLKLSPHGSPNETLLRQWLETGWSLDSWR